MLTLKRSLEWYLGVSPTDPGQGTAWKYLYRTPWPDWLPSWAVMLGLAGLACFVIFIYSRDAQGLSWNKRAGLTTLRLMVVAMVLFFLTEMKLSVDRTGLPVIVVLWDDSQSMTHDDHYPKEDQAALERLLKANPQLAQSEKPVRFNLGKALITQKNGAFLKELLARNKLRIYRFSEVASPVALGEQEELLSASDVDQLLPVLQGLQAEGGLTRPGPAVQKVLDDLRGAPPSAIILLSDGITTTSTAADQLAAGAKSAHKKLVPIYAVALGSEEPTRDLHIYDLLANEYAYINDPILFKAKLKAYGFEDQEVKVQLRQKGSNKILAEATLKAGADGKPVDVELLHAPPEEGEVEYVIEVQQKPNENNTQNNVTLPQLIQVHQQEIRVLLADSMPRYEFRYLKHLLERESRREGNSTLKLDVVLQDADLEYSKEDDTALQHFPVQLMEKDKEGKPKRKYDVIILGDLNPNYLSPLVFQNLLKFVRDDGGGMIMVAGRQFNPLAYRETPLETLLPVELSTAKAPPANQTILESFPPELTLEGRKSSSIFRFADSETESLKIWKELPELYWLFEAPQLKPGAVRFVQHPVKSGADGRLPVICMQRYGGGKVIFHATDELWRWRFRRGDAHYGRYWIQTIRYLARSELLEKNTKSAQLSTDRKKYQQGDTIHFRLRFRDERLIPTGTEGVTIKVERRDGRVQEVKLKRSKQNLAVFEGTLRAVAGTYHAWVVKPGFSKSPPSEDFQVEAKSEEMSKRSMDRDALESAAKLTHGKLVTLKDAEELPAMIPPGEPVPLDTQQPIPLWNRPECFLLFAVLLSAEWLWRKRLKLV